jgi:TonB-linked SusC/RagA family outer membrane protein
MIFRILLHRNYIRVKLITILLFVNLLFLNAQDSILVKGVILSGTNNPVPNVSINIENSLQLPVVTNDSGKFAIKAATGDEWIIISPAADFKMKRVYLDNRMELKIVLTASDIFSGDDELNVLNRPLQRKNMISSHSDLNLKSLPKTGSLSFDQYLQGTIPGAYVANCSGMPGSGVSVNIRGINSINATNQPLIIVDGIPTIPQGVFSSSLAGYNYNQLLAFNPQDISKITVIKDPLILAVYGTYGSNGVIIVETLDPQSTQTTIDVEAKSGISLSPQKFIPQLNGQQHKTLMQEVLYTSGLFEEDIKTNYPSLFLTEEDDDYINYQHNTDWQSIVFDNATFNNINLNIKGGDEIARYGLSFGYTYNKGIIKNTSFQGYNLRFISKVNIFRWLKMNAGVSLNYGDANLKESAVVEETSPLLTGLAKSPLLNPYQYDVEGNRISLLAEVDEIGVSNPLAIIENYSAQNHNYNFTAFADFESMINKYLSLKTKFGFTYNVLKEAIFMPTHGMERYYNQEAINVAKGSNNDINTFYNNTYLNFNKYFGHKQLLTSNTGVNIQSNKFQYDFGLTKNANENDKFRGLQDGQDNLREIGGNNRKWNWLSFYENVSYTYKDRYLVSASVSLDMSSRLGKNAINTVKLNGVPFGLFYSGGIAWRISNESFMNKYIWLEDLKIRVSAGKSGNSDIGESSATNYYKAIKFRETVGVYPYVMPNDNLSYETVNQINAGIDVSLWGNRFTTNFDIFKSTTKNMLIFTPIEPYLGYLVRAENGGELSNKGWELNTSLRIVDKKYFKWDFSFNISSVENKVSALKGEKQITRIEGAELVNMVGSPANSFYGYIFKGVYSTKDEASAANLVNNKFIPFQAGDAIFEDISGPTGVPDGVINDYDKTAIGSVLPKYFGGVLNNFRYKRWGLNVLLQFVSRNDVFNYLRYKNERMTNLHNQSQNTLNRWQREGQVTNVPRALWNDPMGNSVLSTRWIEDGSYFRLKNITLSYKIPDKFLSFRNGEFYISVTNIYTFSKYLGYDPEFAYSFTQIEQGVDYGQTPQPRQFIAGIKIGL